MDSEKELLEYRIKLWKRKLATAHTMLRKYEAKLARFHKRQQQLEQQLAVEISNAAGRKFKF